MLVTADAERALGPGSKLAVAEDIVAFLGSRLA
jgi:hypothetical protein